ncbi:NADH-quinone oxidoreductase subunit NuoN [Acidiphilium iwatense]|uniref:NADH-quinone oxidoreductase subunit N n=2 Tax=Acidiphilium iwatense TaxID=768198 RepID=A0ABS9DWK0_9PROT|nr:NADH-quinone oxidoreductase subunit NuoN [Acidiphilium sp. AL]MCF3947064.1 NADH-quinone oxidoreductase subunit NuoN [Acidiphilium iwatense]
MAMLYTTLPVLFLAIAGMVMLMFGVFARRDHTFAITAASIVALAITARLIFAAPDGQVFHAMLVTNDFTRFADILVLVGAAGALSLSVGFNERTGITRFEYPVLILFSVIGMVVLVSAGDLLTLYIGFEIQSLALYVLATFARNNVRSSEAGLKYFVLGALSSGVLLYGISLVYGFAGTTSFVDIAHALARHSMVSIGSTIGIVFVMVGLAFKISAAPFHMWTPDVYEGSPSSVTAFFATAPKVATFALLLRVMLGPFAPMLAQWQDLVQIVAAASMVIGALGAIGQSNIKRLMAYSSIGHMGYALMGLAAGTVTGVRGALIYLAIYLVMSLGTFGCIIAMSRKGKPVERIDDLAGMASEDGRYALALAVLMLAMAGIPPLSGFFGKLYVFLAAIRSGLDVLAVIGVATSAIAAFYYLRVIKVMYFDTGTPGFDRRTAGINLVIGVSAAVTVLFVFYPSPLSTVSSYAAHALFQSAKF